MLNFVFKAPNFWVGILIFVLPLMGCTEPQAVFSSVSTAFPQKWQNVAIGGGGYVTNIYIHPKQSDLVYAQTDNGGFYRWEQRAQSWHPITDHFSLDEKNYYGGVALALDPHNPDVVLIAVGQYVSEGMGTVFRSEDRGQSWQSSNFRVPMGADQDKRWAGNRLAINPFDPDIVLFGSREEGLWRSQDGGLSWQTVSTLSAKPNPDIGLLAIAFDPSSSGRIALGAYGDGIYESTDTGLTWRKLEGSPAFPMRLAIAQDGALYVTSDRAPGLSHYRQGVWSDVTPSGYQGQVFNGLSVHPTDPNHLIASLGEVGSAEIFYSKNRGQSWFQPRHDVDNTVPWLPDRFFRDHTAAIQFNPSDPSEVWLTDWFGIWKTEDIDATPIRWKNLTKGHEQVVVFALASPPQGALLLSGVADVNGFLHERHDQFPSERLGPEDWIPLVNKVDQDTYSLAYSATDPLQFVRVGGKRWNDQYGVYTSPNGGRSWRSLSSFPNGMLPLRVAVSATNPQNFVVIVSDGKPVVTMDGGRSWTTVRGLPLGPKGPWTWVQPLAADGGLGDRYYYYSNGTLYRSDDRGETFEPIQTQLPNVDEFAVHTMPGLKDWLWISFGSKGLYFSKDGGQTLEPIDSVSNAHLFTVGVGEKGAKHPIWYLYGTVLGKRGIFMSSDQGKIWVNINESKVPIGAQPRMMEASKQHLGLIFIGTNGRGIYFKQVRP